MQKKHYGKVQLEDGNCPSGGRNKKCHCILKNNKVSTKIYKMQKKRKILNSSRKVSAQVAVVRKNVIRFLK